MNLIIKRWCRAIKLRYAVRFCQYAERIGVLAGALSGKLTRCAKNLQNLDFPHDLGHIAPDWA